MALLIGMSGGGLIDGLIACSSNLERGGGRGRKEDKERMRGFNAAENGRWTWAKFGKRVEGVDLFVTDFREICRRRVRMRRRGGALAEGRKIHEMIGGRALFGWTVARNKSRGFRVSST